MIEFLETIGKGILQGIKQFIDNDLQGFLPLFVIAAILLLVVLLRNGINHWKS